MVHSIDLQKKKFLELTDFFSQVEFIPLETTENSAINFLSKVLFIDGKIYALDKRAFAILVFDESGKFIRKIQNVGNGPGEYLDLYDFNYNAQSRELELMSARGKLISYDLSENTFSDIFSLPNEIQSIHHFTLLSNDIILLYSYYDNPQLIFFSRTQKRIVKTTLENVNKDKKIKGQPIASPFYELHSEVYFVDPYSYNIYKIEEENLELIPVYRLDFGHNNIDLADIPPEAGYDMQAYRDYIEKQQIAFPLLGFFENKDLMAVNFMQSFNMAYTVVYNKQEQSYKYLPFNKARHGYLYPFFAFNQDEIIGCIYEPEETLRLLKPDQLQERSAVLDPINQESNPVLFRFKTK
jgi:hypothetical protein